MREHRNSMVAIVDIARNGGVTTDGQRRVDGRDVDVAVRNSSKSCSPASRPKESSVAASTRG